MPSNILTLYCLTDASIAYDLLVNPKEDITGEECGNHLRLFMVVKK